VSDVLLHAVGPCRDLPRFPAKHCDLCGKPLVGRQQRWCSLDCSDTYWAHHSWTVRTLHESAPAAGPLLTVADGHGNVIAIRLPVLTDAERAVCAAAWDRAFPDGLDAQAAGWLITEVARDLHDEAAYERVCARRGLLPL
jgi:hypothetical protein